MELLLYCTKAKPLFLTYGDCDHGDYATYFEEYVCDSHYYDYEYDDRVIEPKDFLNGKIVGGCDYELEDNIFAGQLRPSGEWLLEDKRPDILKEACLEQFDVDEYLGSKMGYAIHINNLKVFDKPKELSEYFTDKPYKDINKIFTDEIKIKDKWYRPLTKAPQNMCYVYDRDGNKYALISIHPEWLCKILNGEKTIEVRKKVLKEMQFCIERKEV